MIGNDIIDLALAQNESNWQRKGFLNKIFTEREQSLILTSVVPETMVWSLWSRKEAAYKIYNRETNIRSFIPIKLECYDIAIYGSTTFGKVICYEQTYYTKTQITKAYVETVAVLDPVNFNKIRLLHPEQKIYKTNGMPYYRNEQLISIPISISHHGRFERRITLSE